MRIILLAFIISLNVFAQHAEQPQKESSADLRAARVLFSIEDVNAEKTYWLERTSGLDHFLRLKDDEMVLRKVDGRMAQKLDLDFASRFLRCQYELPSEVGDCKVLYRLTMKGETQDICKKDEKKSREIEGFVKDLSKRF